jgi:hypothetical protein
MVKIVECDVDKVKLGCPSCGTFGWLTREIGSIDERMHAFILSHRSPHILAAHLVDSAGAEVGWWTPRFAAHQR